jgi:hypothetical protein
MKKLIPSLLLALFSFVTVLSAADNALSKSEKADGWKLLFNGKNLNNWKIDKWNPKSISVLVARLVFLNRDEIEVRCEEVEFFRREVAGRLPDMRVYRHPIPAERRKVVQGLIVRWCFDILSGRSLR